MPFSLVGGETRVFCQVSFSLVRLVFSGFMRCGNTIVARGAWAGVLFSEAVGPVRKTDDMNTRT